MKRRKDHAPPANWQDFEDLCLKLWRPRLIDAKKNGRAGQPQAGVDIFGRDPKTEAWVGIQCKQKGRWPPKSLTIRQMKEEIRKAAKFKPPLSHFIIATTAVRDGKSQEFVRRLGTWRRKAANFSVDLFAWDDIQDWLQECTEGEAGRMSGFDTFLKEAEALRAVTQCGNCTTSELDVPGFGMLFGCIEGDAATAKLFVNEMGNSGQVENVKVMWDDWYKDLGYGLHADRREADEIFTAVVSRYAPDRLAELKRSYFGREPLTVIERAFRLVVAHHRGPAIDQHLLTVTEARADEAKNEVDSARIRDAAPVFERCKDVLARDLHYPRESLSGDGRPIQNEGFQSFMLSGKDNDLFFVEVYPNGDYNIRAAFGKKYPFKQVSAGRF